MPIIKTEAFILKSLKYGESSKILTLFTKELGKLNAIVKGARKFSSKQCGVYESMNYINAVIYLKENRDLQIISSSEYIKSFPEILQNYDKLQSAFKITELLNKSIEEQECNLALFSVLVETFELLNIKESHAKLCLIYFEKELIKFLGIYPDFGIHTSEVETFFGNMEFIQKQQLKEYLKIIENKSLEDLEIENVSNQNVDDVEELFERHLFTHISGMKYFNSGKIFSQLNPNFKIS